jgi:GT2 family glycosyltransferase
MKRVITQKVHNFIALYEAKGLVVALSTLLLKIFSYLVGSRFMQELNFNIFSYRKNQMLRKNISSHKKVIAQWHKLIKISIFLTVFTLDSKRLKDSVKSIQDQIYDNFEVIIACNNDLLIAEFKFYLEEILTYDPRFKLQIIKSQADRENIYNILLNVSSGEFIACVDAGDQISMEALYEVVKLLNHDVDTDFIYSDDAGQGRGQWLTSPFFKPDWNPDDFLSRMYTGRLAVFRKNLVEQVGGYRHEFGQAQEYEMTLRLVEATQNIKHIPRVLYFWHREYGNDSNNRNHLKKRMQVSSLSLKAIEETLRRRKEPGKVVIGDPSGFMIRYKIHDFSKVSIIIPTRDLWTLLDECLESIFSKSTYPNYEVIIVDNGSQDRETFQVFAKWRKREPNRFRIYHFDIPFNYSRLNNYAVDQVDGKYLLFLNNDVEVIQENWIEAMVEQAQRPSIGAVGALLLYPDNTIQHGGVILGLGGAAGHVFCDLPYGDIGYFDQPNIIGNYTAVTAACLMCRRDIFKEVKGFEEILAVAYNDTDFCLKLHSKGYRNIYLPHVILYHHESKSRGRENTPEKKKRFAKEIQYLQIVWRDYILCDPSYNPNLTRERSDFSFDINRAFSLSKSLSGSGRA